MRQPKPFYRPKRRLWYVQIGKRQINLGPDEAEAWKAYHRLMAAEGRAAAPVNLTVREACNLFLFHSEAVHTPGTFEQYRLKLGTFVGVFGPEKVDSLKASRVQRWAAGLKCSESTRRGYITAVKVALGWCVKEGHATVNPVAGLKRPPMGRRKRTLTPDERRRFRDATDEPFRDLLDALTETGARPSILVGLEARQIDWEAGEASVISKGHPYRVTLTARARELFRRLADRSPEGPIFRNSDGQPWTRNAIRCRFARLRAKLGIEGVTAYTYRHSFVTDALERGVNPAAVAELAGHSDLRMISNHYSHLAERRETLRRAAEEATAPHPGPASGRSNPEE